MEDFLLKFEAGLRGENVGMESGLAGISESIDNIQKETNYVIFGPPKTFKTKFTDAFYILYPFMNGHGNLMDYTYYSFEVSRIKKVAEWIAFFFWYDYKLKYSAGHIMSRAKKRVKDEHLKFVEVILKNRIIPLLGEYNSQGKRIKDGVIDFIEDKDNPTGIYNHLIHKAKLHGEVIMDTYETVDDTGKKVNKQKIVSFVDWNPEKYRLVICDHKRMWPY